MEESQSFELWGVVEFSQGLGVSPIIIPHAPNSTIKTVHYCLVKGRGDGDFSGNHSVAISATWNKKYFSYIFIKYDDVPGTMLTEAGGFNYKISVSVSNAT